MIFEYGSPILRVKCTKIDSLSDPISVKMCIEDLKKTLELTPNAVALSANQLGHKWCAFSIRDRGRIKVVLNPILLFKNDYHLVMDEGCMSIPGPTTTVERYGFISVEHGMPGNRYVNFLRGYEARVWQHEIDHLNSILIYDHISTNEGKAEFLKIFEDNRGSLREIQIPQVP